MPGSEDTIYCSKFHAAISRISAKSISYKLLFPDACWCLEAYGKPFMRIVNGPLREDNHHITNCVFFPSLLNGTEHICMGSSRVKVKDFIFC